VTSSGSSRLRIAAIDFLNPAPLMWDFEHEPAQSRLAQHYSIHRTMPSECAAQLESGDADVGLIPIASYATIAGLSIIPGCTIASQDRVRSILLVVRTGVELSRVRTVAADTSSLTSLAYTQILFNRYWSGAPEFVPQAPDLETMLARCDAALLIGDPALLALEGQRERKERTGESLQYIDLAHEWRERTGTPWVSAFWAVRNKALAETSRSAAQVVEDFVRSRDHGLAHIDDIATEWASRIPMSPEDIRAYLTGNIHYVLDEACLEGMDLFFRYAEECAVLPQASELKWLNGTHGPVN
jgi:chorismate dehydratase